MVSAAGFRVLCVKRPQVSVVMPTTVAQRRHISTPHWAALASTLGPTNTSALESTQRRNSWDKTTGPVTKRPEGHVPNGGYRHSDRHTTRNSR